MLDRYDFEFDGERLRIFTDENRAFLYAPDVARILGMKTRALARELAYWQFINDEEGGTYRVYPEDAFMVTKFSEKEKGEKTPEKFIHQVDTDILNSRLNDLKEAFFGRILPELRITLINKALKEREEDFSRQEQLEMELVRTRSRISELEQLEVENLKLFDDNRALRERLDVSRKECLRLAEEQRDALREANSSLRYARGLREVCIQMRGKLAELAAMYGSRHVVLLKLVDAVDEALKAGMETGGCQE